MDAPLLHPASCYENVTNNTTAAATATNDDSAIRSYRVKTDTKQATQNRFLYLGILIGFSKELISLGAYVYIWGRWERKGAGTGTDSSPSTLELPWWDNVAYGFLWILTKADLFLYSFTWLVFLFVMTRPGANYALKLLDASYFERQQQSDDDQKSARTTASMAREGRVVSLGVHWVAGLVIGAFLSWSLIEISCGFPVPFFPLVVTTFIDLLLCVSIMSSHDYFQRLAQKRSAKNDDGESTFDTKV